MKTVALGSVCKLVNGKAFKPSDWTTVGVPIVRIQNLNDSDNPFNYFAGDLTNQVPIKAGDLLLAWSGTPGTSFGAHVWWGGDAILNQHIFRCDIDRTVITPAWAKFVINMQLDHLIDLAHGGVGLKHVTRGVVDDLKIPLPPLPEQQRIAEILDRADALRAKRRAGLAQLDTLTQSIFFDLFGDPVRNEKGWPSCRLGDICELVRGSSPRPQGDARFFGGPVPRLMVADITRDGWFATPRIDSLTLEGAKRSRPVPSGTVVMAVSGNVGLVSRLAVDACIHDGFVAFTGLVESQCDPGYLLATLHFSKRIHEQHKAGAIFVNLTTTDIKGTRISLPPLSLQKEFNRRVRGVDDLRRAFSTSLHELDALGSAMQHRAFRGEL